jgi:hypothetical protein
MNTAISKTSRPHTQYKLADGTRVPGVTTILGVIAKPALIGWANRQGLAGIDTTKYVQQAATAGTIAHYMIECHVTGKEPDLSQYPPDLVSIAENGFIKWLDWEAGQDFKILLSEAAMVSEEHHYGGTIDVYAECRGEKVLIDIKTSDSGIWPEMRHQVAAYRAMLIENGHPVDRVTIVRVGKESTETFATETIDNLDKHFELFLHAKEIYRLQKEIN